MLYVSVVHSFLLRRSIPLYECTIARLFIHSPVEEHMGCFQVFVHVYVWAIRNKAPRSMQIRICVCAIDHSCSFLLGTSLGMGSHAGSYYRLMSKFIRNCQAVCQNTCITLDSHQQHMRIPFALQPRQQLFKLNS